MGRGQHDLYRRLRRYLILGLAALTVPALLMPTWMTPALAMPALTVPGAGSLTLRGRVTNETDTALEGAKVVALAARSLHQEAVDTLYGRAPTIVADATTDEGGFYALEVPPGAYELVVTAHARVPRRMELDPVVESLSLKTAALPEATRFRLRVLDADGAPVAGATVRAQADNGERERDDWHGLLQHELTDEHGVVRFILGPGRPLDLRVLAADGRYFYQDGMKGTKAEVTLEAGAEWTLRTEDARGQALAGVVVSLTQARIPAGRTDEEGRFRVRLPAEPPVTLRLSHDDGYYLRTAVTDDPQDHTRVHTFVLPDPTPISGRVVDLESGEGIGGALAWAFGKASEAVLTDRAGGFTVTPLPGIEWLQAAAGGYGSDHADLRAKSGPAAGTGEAVIRLPLVTRIAGRVVDPDGAPIDGAEVEAVALPGLENRSVFRSRSGLKASTVTSGDGSFLLSELIPDLAYRVTARRAGFAPGSANTVTAGPPEVAEVGLVLQAGIQAVGSVVDGSEAPLAGATVELFAQPRNAMPYSGSYQRERPSAVATTGSHGEYSLPDVGPGSYLLEVRRPGFAQTTMPGIEITDDMVVTRVITGETVREVDLGVISLVPGAHLEGVVRDDQDHLVEGAVVIATPEVTPGFYGLRRQDTLLKQTTGADGRFRFVDLTPAAPVRLNVSHAEYSEIALTGITPPTEAPLNLLLQRFATLRGRVLDAQGTPVAGVTVGTRPAPSSFTAGYGGHGGPDSYGNTDAQGAFEVLQALAGRVTVQVSSMEGWRLEAPMELDLVPTEVREGLELRVSQGTMVRGIVRRPDGRPVVYAEVSVSQSNLGVGNRGHQSSSTTTNEDGTFTLTQFEPGPATALASHPNHGETSRTIELVKGPNQIDLVLEPGTEILGQVLTPEGGAAAGALIRLQPHQDSILAGRSFSNRQTVVDAEGRFRLPNVADGTWLLLVDHTEFASYRSEALEIDGSPVAEQLILLSPGISVSGRLIGVDFDQLATAQVMAYDRTCERNAQIRHDGSYRLEGLSAGSWGIHAMANQQTRTATLHLEEGQAEATLDLDFSAGYELTGSVRIDGRPVEGLQILLVSLANPTSPQHTQTNFQGEFRLSGVEEGPHLIQARGMGDGFGHRQQVDVPTPLPVDIDVKPSRVEGTVRSSQGLPLQECQVTAERGDPATATNPFDMGSFALRHTQLTGRDGVYRLARLPEGTWRLVARCEEHAQAEVTIQTSQGADQIGIDFTLEPADGLWFDLQVLGDSLAPIVEVAISTPDGGLHSVVYAAPDTAGAVHLSTVPAGTWLLVVTSPGLGTVHLSAEAPADRPHVTLQPQARIDVSSPDFDDTGMLQAKLTRADGTVHQFLLGGYLVPGWPLLPGRRAIEGLTAGTWTVEVQLPDGRVLHGTTSVATGETVNLDLSP